MNQTPWLTFVGANIRGTPPMRGRLVNEDIRTLRGEAESMVLCEFKWDWYWEQAQAVVGHKRKIGDPRWKSTPNMRQGYLAPVLSAQPNFWDTEVFRKTKAKRALCHMGMAGISEMRMIRGALLNHLETSLEHWEVVAHFVVGGDMLSDGEKRKKTLRKNIRRFARFIGKLVKTGKAIIGQLDANIHPGTWAYTAFMKALAPYKPKFHGEMGVEYLFTIDGKTTEIEVRRDYVIRPKRHHGPLNTDHEARAIVYRLRETVDA